jgi:AcrR family transcriptional regulator
VFEYEVERGKSVGLREIKMGRTRRQIADHAFTLFRSQGFEATTIEQIATAAEVGTRTLYRYYPTKESLIVDFVETSLRGAVAEMREQPMELPLPRALYTVIETVLRIISEDAERVLAVYQMAAEAPSVHAKLADLSMRWRLDLSAEIARRSGDQDAESVALAAHLSAACTMDIIDIGVRSWVASGGTGDINRITNKVLELMHTGGVPIPTPARMSPQLTN